jgi:hypothetical protein
MANETRTETKEARRRRTNLQGIRIRAPEGWPSCNVARQRWSYGAQFVRGVTGFDASPAAALPYVARAIV